ncbi:Antitoxin VapB [Bosea sp. 62]|uniref:type II toxin-antitoxin system VapB family antitoxin n=1 Tax=unclassified Bosea (in: a-proteobacteria) TaxID=2653178 RepID=UPI001252662E|nr:MULTISPECIES: type II toxin-antitoxin system VapB family antitoxin [unclassified Bosea (in: a-proteobacteria)]CAD5260143.1 Antitoxin VapB [Bosea sp. 7B]CAD5272087.1 Antitoxin VapB [Bosea sp. 21B]CAD5274292.1 Antitoxin VapB [Bosea sp. 46]VVT59302.1 Antitoxin VapB [Bosea sp. EC-HK365B]VXC26592.1 Antitoxin VapB [Bosea sp. 127]
MAFHIRDPETDRIVRALAAKTGATLTDAVRKAAEEKLARVERNDEAVDLRPLRERIRDIQERVAAHGKTGLKADKAFFDWLSGDE